MTEVIVNLSNTSYSNVKLMVYFGTILILSPLCLVESMKHISYISITAMISILVALLYLIYCTFDEILNPSFEKIHTVSNISGLPYFFGISLFLFEGNALSLEIEHQMQDGK